MGGEEGVAYDEAIDRHNGFDSSGNVVGSMIIFGEFRVDD